MASGEKAKIQRKKSGAWSMTYKTLDGNVVATFRPMFKKTGSHCYISTSKMTKSDGNNNFSIQIYYKGTSNVKIKMFDDNPEHTMQFSKKKFANNMLNRDESTTNHSYDKVLEGDLTPFMGQFSSDSFNQTIVDSGMTYGGYEPKDYYERRTTVFPAITKTGYWNGITSHGSYVIKNDDLPKKIKNYYEIHVYGANSGAINSTGSLKRIFYLVPPKVEGPDGKVLSKRQVFEVGANNQLISLSYQSPDWWKRYKKSGLEKDLDVDAIYRGDFSSLKGTWRNGKGEVLTINDDGSTDDGERISIGSTEKSRLPSVGMSSGNFGVSVYLFQIGVSNPYIENGHTSDTTRPRLAIGLNPGDFPTDAYYYRY
ncbi:TPA: hypothetical protein VAU07_001782 [Streptococcus agalactiae]|nr:hypothetical protein [Streptococcus agalactiae]